MLSSILTILLLFFTASPIHAIGDNRGEQTDIRLVHVRKADQPTFKLHLKEYPDVEIRATFTEVFEGFSLKGKRKELDEICEWNEIVDFHGLQTYKTTFIHENLQHIDIPEVQRLYDRKGHRLTGKGIKVGVVDTGIDYLHPDLQLNYKGGYDAVDLDEDPFETREREGTPTSHGTHVAGIIGANGKIEGVARDVELYAYRGLGPGGSGSTESVLLALEHAVKDGMDVINLSLGSNLNGPDTPISEAVNRAVEKGCNVVVAGGNEGPGEWTIGSPGTASKAITVGASYPPLTAVLLELRSNQWLKVIKLTNDSIPLYRHFYTVKENEVSEESNKHPFVITHKNGEKLTVSKISEYEKLGAVGVVVSVADIAMNELLAIKASPISVIAVKPNDYQIYYNETQHSPYIMFHHEEIVDEIASFSSRGPVTYSWEIKPDIVAPGVLINSTVPSGYRKQNGTSMATPHVAGVVALIKQAHPDWSPEKIKVALMNNTKILQGESNSISPRDQGSGRIQTNESILAEQFIYPSALRVGKLEKTTENHEKGLKIKIENEAPYDVLYRIESIKNEKGVKWKLPVTINVPRNGIKEMKLQLFISKEARKGIHEGFIIFHSNYGHTLHIPYLFIVGTSDHPRLSSIEIVRDYSDNEYLLDAYLGTDVKELTIMLVDKETGQYYGTILHGTNIKRGMLKKKLLPTFIPDGKYEALIYVKDGEIESTKTETITIKN